MTRENPSDLLRCSFCNKSQREVRKLIAGPNVYICDECVDICLDIIAEDRAKEARDKAEEIRLAVQTGIKNLTQTVRDVIAEGIVQAVRQVGVAVPVIVRLEGTNADKARKILAASKLAITAAKDLTDAAGKAVRLARRGARR